MFASPKAKSFHENSPFWVRSSRVVLAYGRGDREVAESIALPFFKENKRSMFNVKTKSRDITEIRDETNVAYFPFISEKTKLVSNKTSASLIKKGRKIACNKKSVPKII
jgi:hypothetical protein